MAVFLARAQLPGTSPTDIESGIDRLSASTAQLRAEGFRIQFLGGTYVPSDGWLGSLYAADTTAEVRLALERAVMPFDEIVEAARYGDIADQRPRGGHAHAL
jgi:hypothetical protein